MAGVNRVIETDNGLNAFITGLKSRTRQSRSSSAGVGIKVGITADDDARPDGESNIEIATHHEFGAPKANIPKRSFIRWTVDKNRKKYNKMLADAEREFIRNPKSTSLKKALFKLGETAVADVQKRIDSNVPPPLSDKTVERKGDSLALVDTGEMRGAITWTFVGI